MRGPRPRLHSRVVIASLLTGQAVLAIAPAPIAVIAERLAPLQDLVEEEIAAGRIPGAVVLIGQGDATLFRRAFGWRTALPARTPMTVDTIFDLASLTKVVATTTAVMQLRERGVIDLDASASSYWPQFAVHGKRAITIRDLLTHYSGLKADLDMRHPWSGYQTAIEMLAAETPLAPRGKRYVYSDENFAVLGEIVRRASGLPLDTYSERHIFAPLRMTRTRFLSPANADGLPVAPTSAREFESPAVLVHDPMAARMGGVAGHAGLFSTADDLARFARMLLNGGQLDGVAVLRPQSINVMIQAQSPLADGRLRGLGWDVASSPAADTDRRVPHGSYGHTGYTGTMIWIDPASRVYVILLTNRTYANGGGDAQPLRDAILRTIFGRSAEALMDARSFSPAAARGAFRGHPARRAGTRYGLGQGAAVPESRRRRR